MQASRVLIVGCGYLGEAVADQMHGAGWEVTAWTASQASAERLAADKPYAVAARDIGEATAVADAAGEPGSPDVIIDCVSSGRGGADQYRRVYFHGAQNLLALFPAARLIFTGSTSVYAQTDGSWVDETSPTQPTRETGRILLETEALVRAAGGTVARLSGIYGPGRKALVEKFLAGTALIEGDGNRWLNHIHRDDAAAALAALAAGAGATPGIYNVSDSNPLTQRELYQALAKHFDRALPGSGPVDHNRKRGWTSKRVGTQRLRATGWEPRYASYLDGILSANAPLPAS